MLELVMLLHLKLDPSHHHQIYYRNAFHKIYYSFSEDKGNCYQTAIIITISIVPKPSSSLISFLSASALVSPLSQTNPIIVKIQIFI